MANKLIKGQWVCALEGLAEIIYIHDIYVEEFSYEYLEEKKKIGEFSRTVCVYKLLCDYNGVIRKRSLIQYSNVNMCEPIAGEYLDILNEIRKKSVAEYERHQNLIVKKIPVPPVKLFLRYRDVDLENLSFEINAINQELDKPFVFPDFKKAVEDRCLDIDFSKANKNPGLTSPDFYIIFHRDNFNVRNRRALFTKVEGVVSGWREAIN